MRNHSFFLPHSIIITAKTQYIRTHQSFTLPTFVMDSSTFEFHKMPLLITGHIPNSVNSDQTATLGAV